MQLKEAKIKFECGALNAARIFQKPMSKNYLSEVHDRDSWKCISSKRDNKHPRGFASIDSAAKLLREIGFSKIEINLS